DYSAAFKKNRKSIRSIDFPECQCDFEKTFDLLKKEKFDLIIICNPNNPDGKMVSSVQIDELCRAFPQTVICIDESYQEMSLKCESVLPYVNKNENLLVLKSLTKPFGIGGIRASYAVSSQKIIDRLKSSVLPWGVSSIAQRIIPEFFNEWDYYQKQWQEIQAEKERIICNLNRASITTRSSVCPFFFIACKDASAITSQLLEQYKISVRDCTSFGMPHYIRIMPSVESNNDRLIEVLKTMWEL
ncbi:MAG: aminotransferase class I/II-fold pyridoxal phosphate-dependent enzyme, partial [Fibrobacter sp.]|nr:aminotransferase class I/II-fold pyridoxal phosphate-dependent enzyme [Fibrobacter sp.]